MTPKILKFHHPLIKCCFTCGVKFRPISTWHKLCPTCHRYNRIGQNLAENQRLLREVGQ